MAHTVAVAAAGGVPPELRARLHARFPRSPLWAPPVEQAAEPAPLEVIREVLAKAQADGLSTLQQAGAVYAILVGRGLMDGGHA
ncbi:MULTISPECIES: hypothetical protein [Methylobacterium]|uniref:Uncharacterized protein n=1 Tax=Methylobacterium aquaticum TaxID=270351 RepID=A0A0C6FL86_9HYPH|nr:MULTISPECIES: hypothetical protein [Methylobacterium]NGM36181.1 hypothetical protein [Methylobacterium sp. DB0501]BAQ49178.1 hypothetical protein Maq22A_1p34565 [Methylobacterium aquaticum]